MILSAVLVLTISLSSAYLIENTAKCVSNLVSMVNEEEDHILVVRSPGDTDEFSYAFLKDLKFSVVINIYHDLGVIENLWKFSFYLIIVNTPDDLEIFMENFHRTPAWYPHAKFLVVMIDDENLTRVFELSWKFLAVNLSVLNRNLEIFTYFPYANHSCGASTTPYKIEGSPCGANLKTIFPDKLLPNFQGCPMRVVALIIPPYTIDLYDKIKPGFEIILMRELARRFNYSLTYIKNPHRHWGHKLLDGNLTRMYQLVTSGQAEIMVGLMSVNTTFNNDVDSVDGHLDEYGTFYVPSALPVEPWKNFMLVFSDLVWFLVLVSIVVISFVCWLIGRSENRKEEYKTFIDWLFRNLCILLASFNAHPHSLFLRLMFFLWSIYCLLVYSTYQGLLISFLTKPAYEYQISTLEEVLASDLQIGGTEIVKPLFNEPDNPQYMRIYNNWNLCPVNEECMNRTAQKRDFAVIRNSRQIAYLTPKFYTLPNGRSMLYGLKKNLNRYILRISFVKGFPLFEPINDYIFRAVENGLLYKWDSEQKGERKGTTVSSNDVMVLTVNHLKVAFISLIIGNSIALGIFILELAMFRTKRFNDFLDPYVKND